MWLAHNLSQKGGSTKSMSGFSASRAGGSEATKRRSEALNTKKSWGEFLEVKDQTLNLNILKMRLEAGRFFFFLNLLLVYIYINTQWQCLSSLFHEIGDPVGYK